MKVTKPKPKLNQDHYITFSLWAQFELLHGTPQGLDVVPIIVVSYINDLFYAFVETAISKFSVGTNAMIWINRYYK